MQPADDRRGMVETLLRQGILRDPRVADALARVPREMFLPAAARTEAYLDAPQPIGEGQTISAPHMVAMMAQALDVHPGDRVLEVGGGSGYHAAVLAHLAAPDGRVVTVERHASLAHQARAALAALGLPVDVEVGDGTRGWPPAAPYQRISVAAAAPTIPRPLLEQLAPEGVLVLPVGPFDLPTLLRVRKTERGLQEESLGPCRFVPLVGEHGWKDQDMSK